jgi:hypothetical protein
MISFQEGKKRLSIKGQPTEGISSILDIQASIDYMDAKYCAVFSTWVRNQQNLPVIIQNLTRISQEYEISKIVTMLRWLTKEWRLKSTLIAVNSITRTWTNELDLAELVRGLGGRWKTPYISELIVAILLRWKESSATNFVRKTIFLQSVMSGWDFAQITNVFIYLEDSLEWSVKSAVFQWYYNNHKAIVMIPVRHKPVSFKRDISVFIEDLPSMADDKMDIDV